MLKKMVLLTGMGLALATGQVNAQMTDEPVTCADLDWSAEVLARNPDIGQSCFGVYEKDGKLYAKTEIEVIRVRGNTITFRPLHTDGTKGESRSVTVGNDFRAIIAGREYRASDLMRGQILNVYLPEDRFALHIADEDGPGEDDVIEIMEAEVVEMPTTASPLFLIGSLGAALLALGGVFTSVRRRLS
ncbi:MAG: hypothetical protein AAGA91_12285 [Pseudomonadota bacterium]